MAKKKKKATRHRREGDALVDALDELLRHLKRAPTSVVWLAETFENTPRTIRSWVTMLREHGAIVYSSRDEGELCYFVTNKEARL